MIPCRVFLQKLQTIPESITTPKPKISLTLNTIFYDEIKPFQTKYFCLTTKDIIGIDASIEIQQNEYFIGKIQIKDAFKLALQSQTVQIKINGDNSCHIKQINVSMCLQPVSAFSRKKLAQSSQDQAKRIQRLIQDNLASNRYQTQNKTQISFTCRQPKQSSNSIGLTHIPNYYNMNPIIFQSNSPISPKNKTINLAKDFRQPFRQTFNNYNNVSSPSYNLIKQNDRMYNPYSPSNIKASQYTINIHQDVPLFNQSGKDVEEAQSLQSLAQQRQKILGELFGRFKGIK